MKKSLVILLTLLLVIPTSWAAGTLVDGIYYTFDSFNNTCTVTYTGSSSSSTTTYSGEISIPETVNYEETTYTVTAIDKYAFYKGTNVTSISLPSTLTSIGDHAFWQCSALEKIEVPDNVSTIGVYAFYQCKGLKSVTLGSSLTSISNCLFRECDALESVIIPDKVTSIGNYAFQNCIGLTNVEIGNNVTTITNYAFAYCSALKEVIIPNKVTTISKYAFTGCTDLEHVSLGSRVSSIETYVFNGCSNLNYLESLNPEPPAVSGVSAFNGVPTETCVLSVPSQSIELYKSDEIWSMFLNVEGIYSPITVETLEATNITGSSATLNAKVTYNDNVILEQGFEYWSNSEDVKRISASGEDMSASVVDLSANTEYTFYAYAVTEDGSTYGQEVTFTTNTSDFIVDGIYYHIVSKANRTCEVTYTGSSKTSTTTYLGVISIPETVEYENITYTVIGIGEYAFYNGLSVISISLPNTIEYIGEYAFWQCSGITEITIPEKVTSIETYTFYNCTALTNVVLPSSLTSIGTYAFQYCSRLGTIDLPESLTYIGNCSFMHCSSLKGVVVPEKITTIQNSTFNGCSELISVTLPVGLTSINNSAFKECTSLPEISIPEKVETIESYAFQNCSSLENVYSYNTIPPTCGTSVFFNVPVYACVLFVPSASKEEYSIADTWENFYTILGFNEPVVYTLDATDITNETATLNGTIKVIESTEDIIEQGFEYWTNGSEKFVVTANAIGDMSEKVSHLSKNTSYTYHAYAKTDEKFYYGSDASFSTTNWDCDFYVDGIYYKYGSDESTCEVTYRDSEYNSYSGIVTIPEKTTYNDVEYTVVGVGQHAFRESPDLLEVSLPSTISYIDIWSFYGCTGLIEMIIPDLVTEIGNQAFNGCEALQTLTLGTNVATIGNNSLNCINLEEIYSLNPTPPTCDQYTFRNVDTSTCKLFVPFGSKDYYSTAYIWKDFYNIEEIVPEGINALQSEGAEIEGFYSVNGQKLNSPQRGVNIVRYSDNNVKKIFIK